MQDQDRKAVKKAAELLGLTIRTAPKSGGIDDIIYRILTDRQRHLVAREMEKIARSLKPGKPPILREAIGLDWDSDAQAVYKSDCLILIGVRGRKPIGLNCGGCGFKDCRAFAGSTPIKSSLVPGPFCIFKLWDLGIAIASAAKAAGDLGIDNRMMYKAGLAAYRLGLLKGCNPVLGLPLSATGKNIYFDRKEKIEAKELYKISNNIRK